MVALGWVYSLISYEV